MVIMTKLLEENNVDVPDFARRWEHKQENGKPEHALSAWVKPIYDIDVSDLPSDISESEASIPSVEETPTSSPKLPP